VIYFLECRDAVKIGFVNTCTLSSVEARVRQFEIGNPFPITILALMPGNQSVEFLLHRKFAAYRIRGEWFERNEALDGFIAEKGIPADKLDGCGRTCPMCLGVFLPNPGEEFCSIDCKNQRRCAICETVFYPSKKYPNICSPGCQRRFNSTLSAAKIPR
jgi:Meiotically Up-regulated Gene 113 (MUG113) protein